MNKEGENKLADSIIALYQAIEKQGKSTDEKLGKINLAIGKINLAIGELRLSFMKLHDSFEKYAESNNALLNDHEARIASL